MAKQKSAKKSTRKSGTKKSAKKPAKKAAKKPAKKAAKKSAKKAGGGTKGSAAKKAAASKPTVTDAAGLKSPFTKKELQQWRQILFTKRGELFADIGALEHEAMDVEDGHIAPTHQADRGSDADMQDISLRLAENERELLWQIDRALHKIDTGRPLPFGICEHNRKPIPKNRLKLLPWTPISIQGAEFLEEEGLLLQDILIEE